MSCPLCFLSISLYSYCKTRVAAEAESVCLLKLNCEPFLLPGSER